MSEHKPHTESMFVNQNDSDQELPVELNRPLKVRKSSPPIPSTRVSSRAKQKPKIFDPSEYKKKKERLGKKHAAILKKQQKADNVIEAPDVKKQQQPKTPDKAQLIKTPTKIWSSTQIAKSSPACIRTYPPAKRVLNHPAQILKGILKGTPQITGVASTPAASASSFAPASSIKEEKLIRTFSYNVPASTSAHSRRSASTLGNSELERASTVELGDRDGQRKTADVSKWSSTDVYNYFLAQGFEEKDARLMKEQAITGRTLMNMQEHHLKSLNLRLGVFIDMWSLILKFQRGS